VTTGRPPSPRRGRGDGAAAPATAAGARAPISRDTVVETASRLVEEHGVDALTMRRLSDELGVAVTAIYWHVGNRDVLLDALVDHFVADMGTLRPSGVTPRERIVALAVALRARLLARPHVIGLAHERDRTPAMFQPVQAAMAAELAAVGVHGKRAALALQTISTHVVAHVLMDQAAARAVGHEVADASVWPRDFVDRELVDVMAAPTDYDAVFAIGLDALVDALVPTD
jgi:TetR/AcrR family tetracycline transcriptional repressor